MKTYYIHNFHNSIVDFTLNHYNFKKLKESKRNVFGDVVTHKCTIHKQIETPSVLYDNKTELDDICLLLSLFMGFDINYTDKITKRNTNSDCHHFRFNTISECIIETYSGIPYYRAIKKILTTIKKEAWLQKYNNGSHLKLLKEALKLQSRESQYMNSFIIWEHLYYLHNKSCKTENQMKRISAKKKLSDLLINYNFEYNKYQNEKLQDLVTIRNTIVHDGIVPEFSSYPKEIWIFYDLTQFLVAKTLNLKLASIAESEKIFTEFLNEPRNKNIPI